MKAKLIDEIMIAINEASRENLSNTPDFILAEYLMGCLSAFEAAVNKRDEWYGVHCEPTNSYFKVTDCNKP